MGALMAPAWINFSEPAQALEVRAPGEKKKKKKNWPGTPWV